MLPLLIKLLYYNNIFCVLYTLSEATKYISMQCQIVILFRTMYIYIYLNLSSWTLVTIIANVLSIILYLTRLCNF